MTRQTADRTTRSRSQRRFLAAGIRVRGQWRYLVRSSHDPFTLQRDGMTTARRAANGVQGDHGASRQERA